MTQAETSKSDHLAQVRDSVESVYVAIVLAFVLRAFMIEAFVIPTGSMANALYGDHYELTCPSCGWKYAFGRDGSSRPQDALCPNCYFRYGGVPHRGKPLQPSGGDRVLVMKYLYDFSPLQPFDVVVFKNPQNNRENYIKRLIGLPGEGIRIVHGDIFVSHDQGKTWQVRRKPRQAQQAMWQVLHNGDYPPSPKDQAVRQADPPRWLEENSAQWNLKEYGGRVFVFGGSDRPETICFDPGYGRFRPFNGYNSDNQPGYDTENDICTDWKLSCVWQVDTDSPSTVEMTFSAFEDRYRAEFCSDGTVRLLHQRRDATEDDWDEWAQTNVGPFTPGKDRCIALENVDYRASVWVDDKCVLESTDEQYAGPSKQGVSPSERIYEKARNRATLRQRGLDIQGDIRKNRLELQRNGRPSAERDRLNQLIRQERAILEQLRQEEAWFETPDIQLSARGGAGSLWHVDVQRDVFYTQSKLHNPGRYDRDDGSSDANGSPVYDYFDRLLALQKEDQGHKWFIPINTNSFKSWGSRDHPMYLKDFPGKSDLDEFFCLGDNSAKSHDGRSWNAAAPSLRRFDENGQPLYQLGTVPRYNIIGRAMLVYWPAGFPLPILDWPIVPNVGRIRLIR